MHRIRLALVCCLLATACGGKKSARDAAESIFTEVCAHVYRCCSTGEAEFYLGPYTTDETCADRFVEAGRSTGGVTIDPGPLLPAPLVLPNLVLLDEAIAEGRLRVDESALEACLQWLRDQSCNAAEEPDPTCRPPVTVETPCRVELIFRGQVAAGGRCASPGNLLECQEGLICQTFEPLGPVGVCGVPGEIDDFCFTNSECQLGLYCEQLDGTCQRPSEVGEQCRYADPDDPVPAEETLLVGCAPGLSCDPLTDTCVTHCQQGATCDVDADCDQEQGLMCVLSRCDLPRGIGLPCAIDAHCQSDYRCELNPFDPTVRICSPLILDGQACPFGGHPECASGFCHPFVAECAPQVAPPGLCESGLDMQCLDAWCDTTFISCTESLDCPESGVCNTDIGRCEYLCRGLVADADDCLRPTQCESGICVDGTCRTFPTPDGGECTADFQCQSEFCGHDNPRICEQLPLADGRPCTNGNECESGVCFGSQCVQGLAEGTACDDPLVPPCAKDLYCHSQITGATCVPLQDAGDTCEANYQCRGDCVVAWSRSMCDPTPPIGAAICDGG